MKVYEAVLEQLIAGGDVLSVPHVRKMKQRHPHCHMINGYGPTENTTFSSCYDVPADNLPQKSVPIGRPIANSRIYIVDESMQAVPVGVPGELLAAGDGLARGYLNRPDLTSERFIPNPITGARDDPVYRTGDLARYLHDGTIEFLGRLDQQAKVRGYRVEPGELESVLDDHDLVREALELGGLPVEPLRALGHARDLRAARLHGRVELLGGGGRQSGTGALASRIFQFSAVMLQRCVSVSNEAKRSMP